jgi:hypothetical protein
VERCDECGFTYDEAGALAAGAAIIHEAGMIAASRRR